ncbi:carbon storage regulator CsrA [Paenibacillus radicis (ex Gao et al. 2016)]|uniref:Translational regulator CsrA n=1 Tax=Paenibacillus radicis (ex Gao et al. 2016) TaxID=1737354 RepID=A0A917HNW5_9BACL|nr:carbon storage regulator CsrA [Paenibacillus radicis (ex Gao et al. 2016)]GGG84446.1 carbon storage regulator [Paenibacillus radicis (ex Gao et al. 2016)]
MLVLTRKRGESVLIGDDIEISILEIVGDSIKIGIKAPGEIGIIRKELYVSVEKMNQNAQQSTITVADLKNQFEKIKKN